MRRTLTILGAALAGLVLAAGPASAGTGHNHQAPAHKPYQSHPIRHPHGSDCTVAPKCRPAPLPVPAGGWPCAHDKSCGTKHHRPICPPTPTPTPPVVTPPVKHHTPTPVKHVPAKAATPARAVPDAPQLAMTGLPSGTPVLAGLGGLGVVGGASLLLLARRPREVTEQIRSAL